MSSLTKEVEKEFLPLLRIYKDCTVERLMGTPYVPPSPQDPETGVSLKDITISQDPSISARLYQWRTITRTEGGLPLPPSPQFLKKMNDFFFFWNHPQ